MDFSPWDRAKSFQLHEAASLIAGVMPSSKRLPDRDELPADALQYYKYLATAYVLWVTHHDQPDDPNYPKAEMLRGEPQIGSDEPTLAVSIDKLAGEFVSRDELHRWVKATGIKSAYSFGPWNHTATPCVAPESQAEAPAVGASGEGSKKWIPERLAELMEYRAAHGTKKAAEKYGISDSRVRALLPTMKPKATPFASMVHRLK